MYLISGASGGRMAHILAVFSLSLLLFGLLALPTSALPRSSPSLVIAYVTVNSTADPGVGTCDATECTLREAIVAAAAHGGTDTVAFDIPDSDPNYSHTTGVWTIVLASTLSAPSGDIVDGTTQATNYGSDTNPYGPEIEISGEALDPGYSCWIFGSGNTIKGLVINRCPAYGIWITGGDNNTIIGNYIGTDATGTTDQGVGDDGILLNNGAENNTIGGPSQADRNIISGNNWSGIRIAGATTMGNVIKGNYIGTDRTGTTSLGNGSYGVEIHADAHSNTVGPDNIIAYNALYGVSVDGASTLYNRITRNSIHSNGGKGIALTNDANGKLAAPAVTDAFCTGGSGTSGPYLGIEVFSDVDGQGRYFEGQTGANSTGYWSLSLPSGSMFRFPMLTATATDIAGNTSEFSAPYPNGCKFIYLPLIMKNYAP